MDTTLSSWKKLLIQAFRETPIDTNRSRRCGVFNIQQFIYRALENAGIENRSPFTFWQLLNIRYQSKGVPEAVRNLCIKTLLQMDKPSMGFKSGYTPVEIFGIVCTLIVLIAPQTATTFKAPMNGESILRILVPPVDDIDRLEVHLPHSSDYLTSAGGVKISPVVLREASGLAGKSWILQQQDSFYSLQILSASNSDSLEQFCNKHDICTQSAYYQTELNGKPLTRLLYGVYPNHKAAKLAKQQLPPGLKQVSPWARQFKQIKKEL